MYTPWGEALVSHGEWAGVEVLHISRHGAGHPRLSNHVTHRANIAALKELGRGRRARRDGLRGGRPVAWSSGSLVCFDDLHFLSNRLPDGSLCTFFTEPGALERGHWIYEGPFSSELRAALLGGRRGGGRRRARRRLLRPRRRAALQHPRRDPRPGGVPASPPCPRPPGPETVLCGEAELPYALLGFLTDYANGVKDEATPVETLVEMMAASAEAFAAVLRAALPLIGAPAPPGIVYRFPATD